MHSTRSLILLLIITTATLCVSKKSTGTNEYISYEVNLKEQDFQLYWKDDRGQRFANFGKLKQWLDSNGKRLVFAMNAGMFKPDYTPQGLFIQDYQQRARLDSLSGQGNFYLKPNGVFFTKRGKAFICPTEAFKSDSSIQWATQSGPMLVVEGNLHPAFSQGSKNLNIRNGVGVLKNGNIVFAMSKKEVTFYDFARYFKSLGCRNALYLDGFVSKTYLPQKGWEQTDGDLSVLIAVTTNKQ